MSEIYTKCPWCSGSGSSKDNLDSCGLCMGTGFGGAAEDYKNRLPRQKRPWFSRVRAMELAIKAVQDALNRDKPELPITKELAMEEKYRHLSLITPTETITYEREALMAQSIMDVNPGQVVSAEATSWTADQIQLLKDTVCKGITDDEFKIFCYAVRRTGLDPFMKQIHAVKRRNSKTGKEDMTIQVGIDGYRLTADRTLLYAGCDDAVFDNEQEPTKAVVTVYKIVQGVRCAFTASARWNEYYPGDGNQGFFWRKMPCGMLAKVAEALALRKAFPAELSGLYTNEEMAQADKDRPQQEVKATYEFKTTEGDKLTLVQEAKASGYAPKEIKEYLETVAQKGFFELSQAEFNAVRTHFRKPKPQLEAPKEPAPWEKEAIEMGAHVVVK
jgi:phage recombination protein Bet